MSKILSRTHRKLASVTLLAFLIACGSDSSTGAKEIKLLGGASMDFAWIEPGEFLMGLPAS